MKRLVLSVLLMGLCSSGVFAANRTWQGNTNSDWANSANWSSALMPGAGDVARVNLSSNDPVVSSGNHVCNYLYLPYETQSAGAVTMTVSGGILNVGIWISLSAANSHTSTLLVTGGEVNCRSLKIGENGVVDLAGGQLRLTDNNASRPRMAARLSIEQGRLIAYGGAGRIKWDSEGADIILTGELTDALARSPSPADLTTQVASGASVEFSWTPGTGATSHNVYFSSVADEVLTNDTTSAFLSNQTATTFISGALRPNTVYYWRVDEVAVSVTNRGDVWSFRTDDPARNRPTLGVIRWDMYSGAGATQKQELGYLPGEQGFLVQEQWMWRAPFFCRYTNDVPWIDHEANGATGPLWFNYPFEYSVTLNATEQEIAFAGTAGAGLDYWIFGTAPAHKGGWGLHWNLDALLESERRLEINYAMMYRMDAFKSWSELDQTIVEMVWQAKQPNYQTVLSGRPIFYFVHYEKWSETMGDSVDGSTVTNLATAVQLMRDAFSAEGLPDPYLVATAVPAHVRNDSNWVDGAGFDAGNDYRGGYGANGIPGTLYSEMGNNIEPYWDLNRDNLSAALVPHAPCGVNSEPRHSANVYQEPVPGDLTALMNHVMNYIDDNPVECEANTFSMYSWNEHSEGGFLCPLINTNGNYDQPDTWRLDEVGAAVTSYNSADGSGVVPFPVVPYQVGPNLIPNGEFDAISDAVGTPHSSQNYNITNSFGDFGPFEGATAAVTGWAFDYDDPNGLSTRIGARHDDEGGVDILDGTFYLDSLIDADDHYITLNSVMDYRNGLVQSNALVGVTIDAGKTYQFAVNAIGANDKNSGTLTAALTDGFGTPITNGVLAGTLETWNGTQVTNISGADLLSAGQVNVFFNQVNTNDIPGYPSGSINPTNATIVSQAKVYSVSLHEAIIPVEGDLNHDGMLNQADVTLANRYLDGSVDGGLSATNRQSILIDAGMSATEALAALNLTEFDIDGDGIFDEGDISELEAQIAVGLEPKLVMVRADGEVYTSSMDSFSPVFAVDLTGGSTSVVASAADGSTVYGLLADGSVVSADLRSEGVPAVLTLGTFSSSSALVGIDVEDGDVFVVDNDGRVYVNFSGSPLITLSNNNFVDIAVQSATTFWGLCKHEGARTWMRDEADDYKNFHNSSAGVAIANEAGGGYYAINENGQTYGPDAKILQATFGSGWTDLTVTEDAVTNLYCIAMNGLVNVVPIGGSISTLGTASADASSFVAIDWIEAQVTEAPDTRPNVIVILSDDHGFTDLGIYGIDPNVQTPTMDNLAANGAYMTHGYVTAPQCVPSRAGMIAGCYQFRYGVISNDDGYLPLVDSYGSNVVTHADDMKAAGYATGLVGKWHLNRSESNHPGYPGDYADYNPRNRGFDDYFYGFHKDFEANFDPTTGVSVAIDTVYNHADGWDGRTIIQGQAACSFIENHKDEPFYLYFSPYGPHVPRLSSNYTEVVNFPLVDYPMYDAAEDQVRREGLALIKMIDDSVSNIVQTLRDNGLEENTLILFVSDNGGQPKLWESIHPSVSAWDGSENVPRRGEKGSLFEGGINVPMWAYWKDTIPSNQVIEEAVLSLDFMATAMQLATTNIPTRYDGVDLMPRLSGQTNLVERAEPLYWNYGQPHEGEVAIRKDNWKLRRSGEGDFMFNLVDDPNELTNRVHQLPVKANELATDLENFIASLPPEGRVLRGDNNSDFNYTYGPNETGVVDSRYLGGAVYPLPIASPGKPVDSDGDGMLDDDETTDGRNPNHAGDLAFHFNGPGDYRYYSSGSFEGWRPVNMDYMASTNGVLEGTTGNATARAMHYTLGFDADEVPSLLIRLRADAGSEMRFYWATEADNTFTSTRRVFTAFNSNRWETILLPMAGKSQWDGETITQFRVQPVNAETDYEIDYIAASNGDLDLDGATDAEEIVAGTDAARAESIFTLVPTVEGDFEWNGREGRGYTVWHTPELTPPEWNVATNIGVLSSDQLIKLALPTSPTSGFYRVEVVYP